LTFLRDRKLENKYMKYGDDGDDGDAVVHGVAMVTRWRGGNGDGVEWWRGGREALWNERIVGTLPNDLAKWIFSNNNP